MPTVFQEKVITSLSKIPKGKVTTYTQIAKYVKNPKAVRAVGTAVRKNQNLIKIPCFKVVRSDGAIGQYSGPGGPAGKIKLLQKEGIEIRNNKVVNLEKVLYKFK